MAPERLGRGRSDAGSQPQPAGSGAVRAAAGLVDAPDTPPLAAVDAVVDLALVVAGAEVWVRGIRRFSAESEGTEVFRAGWRHDALQPPLSEKGTIC